MKARPFTFWRVLPLIGEPASSYFSRLVMDECSHLPEMYAVEIGVDPLFRSEQLLEHIGRLPILESYKDRLRYWTPVEANGSVHLAGQTFRRNEFRWARRLECRQCLTEAPYQRVWWHLEFFRYCPVHQCRLEPVHGGQMTSGRWWPRFQYATKERLPDVELGDINDTMESYAIRHLMDPGSSKTERHLSHFVETAEFVGRLLNNCRQPSVPPFSHEDLNVGYHALKNGTSGFKNHFSKWLKLNRPPPYAYRIRDIVGWAEEYILNQDQVLDPDFHDAPNPLLIHVCTIIRANCRQLLGR